MALSANCKACGGDRFTVAGRRADALVLRCGTCRAEASTTGLDVAGAVEEDLPEVLLAIGSDPDDPWVTLRIRVKVSQREVMQRALTRVREACGLPEGPLTTGTALEYLSADFLAGAQGGW